jgi:DNA-binding protein H-NS
MTKTYAAIAKQIKKLQAEAERLKKVEVDGVIDRIRKAIDTYGITTADLFEKKTKATPKKRFGKMVKFRDGNGNTWRGMGPRPQWLRDALAAGKTLDEFRV